MKKPLKYWHQSTGLGMGNDWTRHLASNENPVFLKHANIIFPFTVKIEHSGAIWLQLT